MSTYFVEKTLFQLFFRYLSHVQSWSGEKNVVLPIRLFDEILAERCEIRPEDWI